MDLRRVPLPAPTFIFKEYLVLSHTRHSLFYRSVLTAVLLGSILHLSGKLRTEGVGKLAPELYEVVNGRARPADMAWFQNQCRRLVSWWPKPEL